MEAHLTALLAELEQHGRENDARELDHKKKMLNLEPDQAEAENVQGGLNPQPFPPLES